MDMQPRRMTIGQLSKRAGLPVRTIRYYSDEALLPPSDRSEAGYRLYSDRDLVRLDLIRTLRDAGLELASIRKVMRHELGLETALQLRLAALEVHIASQQQVAVAIRAVLRSGLHEDNLRRLHAMTRSSNEEKRAIIERFFDRVADGLPIEPQWIERMVEASTPQMPDDATPEQLDAWIELSGIITEESFVEAMRSNAADVWGGDFDLEQSRRAGNEAVAAARAAIDRGIPPDSAEGSAIAETFVAASAAAMQRAPDDDFRSWMLEKYERHDPRAARYWELVAILHGRPPTSSPNQEWGWLTAAVKSHLRN